MSKTAVSKRWRQAGRLALEIGVGIAVLVVGLVVFSRLRSPDLPDAAPAFTLKTLEGESVSLSQFRGKFVVLNFWATWCGPCRMEIPSFTSFQKDNPEIVVLGVAQDKDPAVVAKAKDELEIGYRVLLGDERTLRAYGITTFPTTVIIGPEGEIRRAYTGVMFRPQLWWATRDSG